MNQNETHILSTKSLPGSLIKKAVANKLFIECVSFIETIVMTDGHLTTTIRRLEQRKAFIIFTSVAAVDAVACKLDGNPSWNIFCLAGTTQKMVKARFINSIIIDTAENASALAKKIITYPAVIFTFFCGKNRMNTLPQILKNNDRLLHEHIVYNTKVRPHKITKSYKAILFYSPSGVKSFFSINIIPKSVVLFSIGKTTSECLKKYGKNIIECKRPCLNDMIEQAIDFYSKEHKCDINTNTND